MKVDFEGFLRIFQITFGPQVELLHKTIFVAHNEVHLIHQRVTSRWGFESPRYLSETRHDLADGVAYHDPNDYAANTVLPIRIVEPRFRVAKARNLHDFQYRERMPHPNVLDPAGNESVVSLWSEGSLLQGTALG